MPRFKSVHRTRKHLPMDFERQVRRITLLQSGRPERTAEKAALFHVSAQWKYGGLYVF